MLSERSNVTVEADSISNFPNKPNNSNNLLPISPQVLRHGPSPLNYLKESIYKYIACVKDAESQPDCEDFLRAPNNSGNVKTTHNTEHLPYHSFKVF